MLFHKVSRHVAQRNPRKSFLLYNQVRGKSIQNWKRPTMDEYLGVIHQIIHGLLNIWTELLYLTFPHEADLLTLKMSHKLTQYL